MWPNSYCLHSKMEEHSINSEKIVKRRIKSYYLIVLTLIFAALVFESTQVYICLITSIQKVQKLDDDAPQPRNYTTSYLTKNDVIYFVLSKRDNLKARMAIRQTWASQMDNLYFVIGQNCPIHSKYREPLVCSHTPNIIDQIDYFDSQEAFHKELFQLDVEIEKEQLEYRDLLIMDEIDVYQSLPLKIKFAYQFVSKFLPDARYVVKLDDDFFVQPAKFADYLRESYNSTEYLVVSGYICIRCTAHTSGKWKERPQFKKGSLYPPFPLGSYGHAVTRPIAEYIAKNRHYLFDYQGEDVSLGIWLERLGDKVKFINTAVMSNGGNCMRQDLLVVGHNVMLDKMQKCYNYTARD